MRALTSFMLSRALLGLLALTSAGVLPLEARPLDNDIYAQGTTHAEAEADAYVQAIREALYQHYGLSPDNPVTRHLLQLPLNQQRSLFDPPTGTIARVGAGFRGNQTFYSRDRMMEEAIRLFVQQAAQTTGLTNIPFALTASVATSVSAASGVRQAGMTSDVNIALGTLMVAMGLPGSGAPTTVQQHLIRVTRQSRPEELANLYQEILPELLEEIRLAEDASPAAVVFGNFNVFDARQDGPGVTVWWEIRGSFFDLRGKSVDQALAKPFTIAQRQSYGPTIEVALRTAYAMAASAVVSGHLLDAITELPVARSPLVVRLCGFDDLDSKLAVQAVLRDASGGGTLTPDAGLTAFTIVGAPLNDPLQLYGAIKPSLDRARWTADLGADGALLIKGAFRCR